jgi:hypothetical protein
MKLKDLVFILCLSMLFIPFFLSDDLYSFYIGFNSRHGFITAFIKFAVLATAGEMAGLRIRSGSYLSPGFGLIPRALVWGILGLLIKSAFSIFLAGVPPLLAYLGMDSPVEQLTGPMSFSRLIVAFSVSFFLNIFFSPVLMTLHRITDAHIIKGKGTMTGLLRPIDVLAAIRAVDWNMHWGFVLKKTIPLFWIPAHTFTFLLPPDFQVLFAALLGIVLGVILAVAAGGRTDK